MDVIGPRDQKLTNKIVVFHVSAGPVSFTRERQKVRPEGETNSPTGKFPGDLQSRNLHEIIVCK